MGNGHRVYRLDKGSIHTLGRVERSATSYHATQNSVRSKIYELFISRIFHSLFSDCHWPWGTETVQREPRGERTSVFILFFEQHCLELLWAENGESRRFRGLRIAHDVSLSQAGVFPIPCWEQMCWEAEVWRVWEREGGQAWGGWTSRLTEGTGITKTGMQKWPWEDMKKKA